MTPTLAQQVEQLGAACAHVKVIYKPIPADMVCRGTEACPPGLHSGYREAWKCEACGMSFIPALLTPTAQPSREELEKILNNERRTPHVHVRGRSYDPSQCGACEDVQEALMAWASPRPLRKEELDELWVQHDHKYGSAEKWRQAIKEAIWQWVTGQREAKHWCSHMVYQHDADHLRGWYYRQFSEQMLEQEWDRCPVRGCGQPRPADS